MKKYLFFALALLAFASCKQAQEPQVMARFVPERYDDFIFENDLVAGRIYGEALESCGRGQITSPGVDVWVKTKGGLVANQRYIDELQNGKSYHINWGNGKDCYKVGRSLGAGGSAILVNGEPALPATNFRSWEILEETPTKVVFAVSYPEYEIEGDKVALTKTFTVVPGTYFIRVDDVYTFSAESHEVAAGINRHANQETIESEIALEDRYAIWEHASDTSTEPEDGMIGVAVVVPGAEKVALTEDQMHALVCKTIKSGETFSYYFGSCWSKAELKTAEEWFEVVKAE